MEKDSEVKGSGSKDANDDGGADLNKARKPRRERKEDGGASSAADEKGTGGAGSGAGAGAGGGADENATSQKPRRRRAADAVQEKEAAAPGGGGWMTSPDKKAASKLSIEEDDEPRESTNPMNKDKFFQENNDDILVIPDLDEDGYDDDHRIAHAPKNVLRKIPSLVELENEVKAAIPSVEGGYDVGILLRTLVPSQFVQETDSTWTFESLMRDITDELMVPSRSVVASSVPAASVSSTGLNTPPAKDGNKLKLKQPSAVDKKVK